MPAVFPVLGCGWRRWQGGWPFLSNGGVASARLAPGRPLQQTCKILIEYLLRRPAVCPHPHHAAPLKPRIRLNSILLLNSDWLCTWLTRMLQILKEIQLQSKYILRYCDRNSRDWTGTAIIINASIRDLTWTGTVAGGGTEMSKHIYVQQEWSIAGAKNWFLPECWCRYGGNY